MRPEAIITLRNKMGCWKTHSLTQSLPPNTAQQVQPHTYVCGIHTHSALLGRMYVCSYLHIFVHVQHMYIQVCDLNTLKCRYGHILEGSWTQQHTCCAGVGVYMTADIENCEGWLSPGGHSSGGRALTAQVRGPRSIPGGCWFSQFSKNIPKPFHHVRVHTLGPTALHEL